MQLKRGNAEHILMSQWSCIYLWVIRIIFSRHNHSICLFYFCFAVSSHCSLQCCSCALTISASRLPLPLLNKLLLRKRSHRTFVNEKEGKNIQNMFTFCTWICYFVHRLGRVRRRLEGQKAPIHITLPRHSKSKALKIKGVEVHELFDKVKVVWSSLFKHCCIFLMEA